MAGAKAAVAVVWVLCIASFFVGEGTQLAFWGQLMFFVLLVAHAVECVVFLPKLRAAGGDLGGHLIQTLIFGIVHVRSLEEEAGPA